MPLNIAQILIQSLDVCHSIHIEPLRTKRSLVVSGMDQLIGSFQCLRTTRYLRRNEDMHGAVFIQDCNAVRSEHLFSHSRHRNFGTVLPELRLRIQKCFCRILIGFSQFDDARNLHGVFLDKATVCYQIITRQADRYRQRGLLRIGIVIPCDVRHKVLHQGALVTACSFGEAADDCRYLIRRQIGNIHIFCLEVLDHHGSDIIWG